MSCAGLSALRGIVKSNWTNGKVIFDGSTSVSERSHITRTPAATRVPPEIRTCSPGVAVMNEAAVKGSSPDECPIMGIRKGTAVISLCLESKSVWRLSATYTEKLTGHFTFAGLGLSVRNIPALPASGRLCLRCANSRSREMRPRRQSTLLKLPCVKWPAMKSPRQGGSRATSERRIRTSHGQGRCLWRDRGIESVEIQG